MSTIGYYICVPFAWLVRLFYREFWGQRRLPLLLEVCHRISHHTRHGGGNSCLCFERLYKLRRVT